MPGVEPATPARTPRDTTPGDTPLDRFGLGLAALGRPAYINLGRDRSHPDVATLRARARATLDAAVDAGVRWVDAARSYGRAEEFLGGWLADRGPDRTDGITVSSKWGYRYTADWDPDATVHEVKEHTLPRFRTQLAETREILGEHLALYQVHSLTADSPLLDDTALQAALAGLGAEGVRVGFSTSGPDQADVVRRGLALRVDGAPVFTAVQSTWNLLEPSVGSALVEAHDAGALVLVKEALANGRLAVDAPGAVADAAARHGVGPDAVALAAALALTPADVVLSGAADPAQLSANLAATVVDLDARERAALEALAEEPAEYWGHRSSLPWV